MALYSWFAGILDYPSRSIAAVLNDCAAAIEADCPDARTAMAAFQDAIAGRTLGQLQELYINAFDLRPDCTLNLGYHLFGDDGRRGLFLAELKGRLAASGVATGSELPDHLSLLLRYMQQVEAERGVLSEDCLLPAVSRMADVLDSTDNPYKHALRALLGWLQRRQEASAARADAVEA